MVLYTKCIKSDPVDGDGIRISVMSRHTLSDGITPDPEITMDIFDDHWKALAPPDKVIGAYCRGGLWEDFVEQYRQHMETTDCRAAIQDLINLAWGDDVVTILCVEPSSEQCHRRLIAEKCKELAPSLEIILD